MVLCSVAGGKAVVTLPFPGGFLNVSLVYIMGLLLSDNNYIGRIGYRNITGAA